MPSTSNKDVVLRLVNGRSGKRSLILAGGHPIPPLALGTHGDWSIAGGQVARVHVMLAFNGETVFVGAVAGQTALLEGLPLRTRWTEVRVPSELRFGGARLTIGRRAGPDDETQVPPGSATRLADARAVAPRPVRRIHRDDEVTCFDPVRLEEALKLSRDEA